MPVMRRKSDGSIIYANTNDVKNDINAIKYVKDYTKIIEEMNDSDDTQVGFSKISQRRDHNRSEKIKDIKKRLKRYCHGKGFLFIVSSNVTSFFLEIW